MLPIWTHYKQNGKKTENIYINSLCLDLSSVANIRLRNDERTVLTDKVYLDIYYRNGFVQSMKVFKVLADEVIETFQVWKNEI